MCVVPGIMQQVMFLAVLGVAAVEPSCNCEEAISKLRAELMSNQAEMTAKIARLEGLQSEVPAKGPQTGGNSAGRALQESADAARASSISFHDGNTINTISSSSGALNFALGMDNKVAVSGAGMNVSGVVRAEAIATEHVVVSADGSLWLLPLLRAQPSSLWMNPPRG